MKRVAIICILLFFPSSVLAGDIIATWVYENGNTIKLSMRDSEHIRMDIHSDSYMLVSGSKVYMVSKDGSQWTAVDIGQMSGMMKNLGYQGSSRINKVKVRYKYTGRKEKIAGYKGKVYLVEVDEGAGYKQKDEVVFSTHSDIKKVNKAWIIIASRMGKMMGQGSSQAMEQYSKEAEQAGYGGILRSGRSIKLQSLEKKSLGPGWYELPEGAKMPKMHGTSTPPPQDKSSSKEQNEEKKKGFFSNITKDKSIDSTVQQVKEGVGSIFKKVFK